MCDEARAEVALEDLARPSTILDDERRIEIERGAKACEIGGGGSGRREKGHRIAGGDADEHPGECEDDPEQREGHGELAQYGSHVGMMTRRQRASTRARPCRVGIAVLVLASAASCGRAPRASDTVVIASGADLESANPLVTIHPLARQVQRYALFVTLARLDEHSRTTTLLRSRVELLRRSAHAHLRSREHASLGRRHSHYSS